jgi:hypothetical protein
MKSLLLTLVCLASTGFAQPIEIATNKIETQGEKRGIYVDREGHKRVFVEVQLQDPNAKQLFPTEGGDSNVLIVKDPELSRQIYEKLKARFGKKFTIQESDGTISITKERTKKTVYTPTHTKADAAVNEYENFRRKELQKLEAKSAPSNFDLEQIEKEKEALARVEGFRSYLNETVSGYQNRCWLRSSWRVILEEAFYNEDFYTRLMSKIESSRNIIRLGNFIPGKSIIERWIKIVKTLKESPEQRLAIMNTQEFDDALSDYGRNLVYSIMAKRGEARSEILKPDADGNFLESREFFTYFNINAEVMSKDAWNKYLNIGVQFSRLGKMRGETDRDTVFTTRYVLNGVPGHWNLLKKPE